MKLQYKVNKINSPLPPYFDTSDECHEVIITRSMSLKQFTKGYRTLPKQILKFRLFDKLNSSKEFYIKNAVKDRNYCGFGKPDTLYMYGYFSMRRGLPYQSRWKQVKLLMQKENIEVLAMRIYPSYS